MSIKLFVTGGTIDCEKIEAGDNYIFSTTHLPQMLEQGRNRVDIDIEVLMLKDSLLMNDADRELILQRCDAHEGYKIVITHGTDTMVETAKVLGNKIKDKTIVLLGAMVPYNQNNSDALYNLGGGITAVQTLPKGVYIIMNSKIFYWNNVRKNKGEFETLK